MIQQLNFLRWTIVRLKPEDRFDDLRFFFIKELSNPCFQKKKHWKFLTVMERNILVKKQKLSENL